MQLNKTQIKNRVDNIKKKLKPTFVSGTVIESKILELYPRHSDWYQSNGEPNKLMARCNTKDIIKAIQSELNQ